LSQAGKDRPIALGQRAGVVVAGGGRVPGRKPDGCDPAAGAAQEGGDRLTIETGRTNNITAIYCG